MAVNSPLPYRLFVARTAKGLSQKALGIAIGISEDSASARMNQYETGKHEPDFATLVKIAKALQKPVCYFYAIHDDMAETISNYYILSRKQ